MRILSENNITNNNPSIIDTNIPDSIDRGIEYIDKIINKEVEFIDGIETINESTETVNESNEIDETTEIINESTETINETTETINESNKIINETIETINESTETINESNKIDETNGVKPFVDYTDDCGNEYTCMVYKHDSVVFRSEKNFKSVRSSEDINYGELLIIEHGLTEDRLTLSMIIENNEYLFDEYHPRITNYANTNDVDKKLQVIEKISHNCFGMDSKNFLTEAITRINHSCDPNCMVFVHNKYDQYGVNIVFMELYALKNIKKGEEITISYGPETSHKRDFECKCGKSLEERIKIYRIGSGLSQRFSRENKEIVEEKIYRYISTPLCKKILSNHYFVKKGIFMNKNTISALTKDGKKMVNNVINKFTRLDEKKDKMNEYGLTETEEINPHKVMIFLHIMNSMFINNNNINNFNEKNDDKANKN